MLKLVKKSVAYTDKKTGEQKTFTKVILRVATGENESVDIEITGAGKDDNQKFNTRLLKMFADKE